MFEDAVEPHEPFAVWFAEARRTEPDVPDAMQLATADATGRPSVRTVLLKEAGPEGWAFYTHYASPKSRDLTTRPYAAAVIHWKSLQRQVRVEGPVRRMDQEASDRYFASRDRASQLGAWASVQSEILSGPTDLVRAVEDAERRFAGLAVPRPAGWGGWVLTPERFEFWQGRRGRLHDRVQFTWNQGNWTRALLAP
ncbi:MAG: pyridoxamine 5'-phosphate oxidase [Deltaproteobacteria bacterium]|nr:pyridoxamine 5'-phosphate oxidase [Deltaproteobacteria bacterium]